MCHLELSDRFYLRPQVARELMARQRQIGERLKTIKPRAT